MTECTTCKIQLSYPPTTVQPLTTVGSNTGFYYITSGVPFNLSYIDGSNNTYLSGLASKAVLHKPLVNNTDATLTIVHKSNTGTQFYLMIPLIYTTTATSSLSNYLNSTSETILELGNDIANKSIEYYNITNVFVVKEAIDVNYNLNSFKNKQEIVALSGQFVTIKSPTQLNDEVVCDYESDSTEDLAKSSEGDIGMVWANIVPIIVIGVLYLLFSKGIEQIPEPGTKLKLYIAFALISGVLAIVGTVYSIMDKTKDKKLDKTNRNYKGIFAGTAWIVCVMSTIFAIQSK